jgi:hypothetical protein
VGGRQVAQELAGGWVEEGDRAAEGLGEARVVDERLRHGHEVAPVGRRGRAGERALLAVGRHHPLAHSVGPRWHRDADAVGSCTVTRDRIRKQDPVAQPAGARRRPRHGLRLAGGHVADEEEGHEAVDRRRVVGVGEARGDDGVDAADVDDLAPVGSHPRQRGARRLVDLPRVRGVAVREVQAIALDECELRTLGRQRRASVDGAAGLPVAGEARDLLRMGGVDPAEVRRADVDDRRGPCAGRARQCQDRGQCPHRPSSPHGVCAGDVTRRRVGRRGTRAPRAGSPCAGSRRRRRGAGARRAARARGRRADGPR